MEQLGDDAAARSFFDALGQELFSGLARNKITVVIRTA